jgi:hypothetical protein
MTFSQGKGIPTEHPSASDHSHLGLVYLLVSNGRDVYADMTLVSMLSARASNPHLRVTLVCDEISYASLHDSKHRILDACDLKVSVPTPEGSPTFRHRWVKTRLPDYVRGRTLFLDGDTLVRGSLSPLATCSISLGAALDANGSTPPPHDVAKREAFRTSMGWPAFSKYFNTGVLLFTDSDAVKQFFSDWHSLWLSGFRQHGFNLDQPSFNAVLGQSDFGFQELSLIYNYQTSVSWEDASRSVIWHFWGTTANDRHSLSMLTRSVKHISTEKLFRKVKKAISFSTPVATNDHLGRFLSAIHLNPELQRKIQYKRSRHAS